MKKPNYENYLTTIENRVRSSWKQNAVSNYGESTSYTFGEMAIEVERVKEWMRRMGIKKGDKVAICGRSSAHWAIAYLSTVTNGSTAVSILPDFTPETIQYLTRHSQAKLLFTGDAVGHKINGLDFGETIVVNMENWEEQIGEHAYESEDAFLSRLDWHTGFSLDDLALINYTSGTTSNPKGVMLTSRSLSSNIDYALHNVPCGPGDQIVGMLPLAHIFGIIFNYLYPVAGGAHVVFLKQAPTPALLMKAFADVKPYLLLTVPLLIEKIIFGKILPVMRKPAIRMMWLSPTLRHIIRDKIHTQLMNAFGGKMRVLVVGGAALNPEVENCLRKLHIPYTCGYGMTECGPLVSYASPGSFKRGSVGRLADNIELRIRSNDPQNRAGELMVRGDNVCVGYWSNEEATAQSFDNGWFHTGDMGTVDKYGNITLRGRCKNMILGPSGQNIYPEEIEAKLQTMPRVAESVVLSRENAIVALVYPDSEGISREELRIVMGDNLSALNKWLPKYAQVAKIELVEKEFEKTPKGSIKRFMYK